MKSLLKYGANEVSYFPGNEVISTWLVQCLDKAHCYEMASSKETSPSKYLKY